MSPIKTLQTIRKTIVNNYTNWVIYLVLAMVLYICMIGSFLPKNLNVRLHDTATEDIQSPVEAIDLQATNQLKEEASNSTPSKYTYTEETSLIQVEKVGDIYDVISDVKSDKNIDKDEAVKAVRSKLSSDASRALSDKTIQVLLNAKDKDLMTAQDITNNLIYEALNNKVKWSDLERVQNRAVSSLPVSMIGDSLRGALIELLHYGIVPNYVFDAVATKRSKQDAANSIEPVQIHQGEVIVKKGELITRDILRELKVVGLLKDRFNILPFIGLFIFVSFIIVILSFEFNQLKKKDGNDLYKKLLMYGIILSCMVMLIKLATFLRLTNIPGLAYILPSALGTLLIRMFLTERLAIVTSIIFGMVASITFGSVSKTGIFDPQMGLYVLISALAGASIIRGNETKPKILQTGMFISLTNMLTVIMLMLIQNNTFRLGDIFLNLIFAYLSGFLTTILTLGLIPVLETGFGMLSTIKLIELSNPNHPLLRKILLEAPGTYHHSVMVANLAERACEVIGANGLLARVAAYYHDIGKTKRPRFFVENQLDGVNPHDNLSPQLSRAVIISHPYDGADILRAHKMPKEIIDIAEQHHGTSLLKYFYFKAKESGQDVQEADFRYPGPKVQTKEAAIVELADSIEAAVRSMKKPTPMKINNLVQSIFNDRLEDGQFDECDLTLHELKLAKKSITETMNGVFHSRIEYPDEQIGKKAQAK
ncbi:HD family phosphohydrolase [Terrilactibacillus laevilacticus]|uniref:HD family phosphohydrolase n=1 Tax=Terrilactibacillus laevilacticus TaxID=1380157 RepID=A0ABW5PU26_9BACI|nr:HD family phosphohydrolase [Terrilactibacillus laevilacticus]